MEEEESSSFLSRLFRKSSEEVLEQEITDDAYAELRQLLMRAKPEIMGDKILLHLPRAEVILRPGKLIIKAKTRKDAEKILRNLHHYSQPPGLWPAYGLTYSLRKEKTRVS
ncbi:hypothetical protein PFDSM3638_08980 [Pyrococcus furiosus DSM 3638]|uniref:Uncharacterized protein n=3 Tax=Pyrococcus furiosus TaxID=2261 RepID=Q8U033_PYRFU|nr:MULTISPECIES: hypothetical protein [Pyrococcus]AAL81910.1 hypothetical protein PF1786 [Pyrococcus furiosus DSM 3638]AFN04855.1 hypothetical protein PFC_09660 [Pyrococcus furiosus COM1]MDK2870256.1 hypothetical protein [Pyrococcus sp.]QEK79388.1 hypothetical protein PFDSM3638_08980 [Pyrococcus furiosus DSM 3638]